MPQQKQFVQQEYEVEEDEEEEEEEEEADEDYELEIDEDGNGKCLNFWLRIRKSYLTAFFQISDAVGGHRAVIHATIGRKITQCTPLFGALLPKIS